MPMRCRGTSRRGKGCWKEAISESIRTGARNPRWLAWFSEVCRLEGRGAEAWQHARQVLGLARQLKDRGDEALALHQLAVVRSHADPPDADQAEAYYQQAMALADELGMCPLQARCQLGLGTLYVLINRSEQACAQLSAAIKLYRAMDMTFWLPSAEGALAQVVAARGQQGPWKGNVTAIHRLRL
jgi:tetratricopeptide (TPR) repeat protein